MLPRTINEATACNLEITSAVSHLGLGGLQASGLGSRAWKDKKSIARRTLHAANMPTVNPGLSKPYAPFNYPALPTNN